MPLLVSNLLATLSRDRTVIAFRFKPEDRSGAWSIDDVYLDPFHRVEPHGCGLASVPRPHLAGAGCSC